jgi:predicted TPR repeat methyltransferase
MKPYNDLSGDWQGLSSPSEEPRYAAIVEMLWNFRAEARILDVGCGEAVLHDWLPTNTMYTGIEPSSVAVHKARERAPFEAIIHSPAERFSSDGERFDGIVFNEMLYYTVDPIGLVRKYAKMLSDGGAILCSVFCKPDRLSLRRRLSHLLDRRRPASNIQCAEMVSAFMARQGWSILEDRRVAIPGAAAHWRIWLARTSGAQ